MIAALPCRKSGGFEPATIARRMESNRATRKQNWSQRTLAGELARERLVYPREQCVLAALEAAQVTGDVREMVGNLVADIEAREAALRAALEDLLALFKRIELSACAAVEQAEQTLNLIPRRPMCLKNANGGQG